MGNGKKSRAQIRHVPLLPIADPKCKGSSKRNCRTQADELAKAILKDRRELTDDDMMPALELWEFSPSKRAAFAKKDGKPIELQSENFGLIRKGKVEVNTI